MNRKQIMNGYLAVLLSAVIFGCMPLMVKQIYADGVNSLSVVFLRNVLSLPAAALLALRQNKSLKINPKALPTVARIGVMGCCVTTLLLFSSYFFMASGTATVLHFIYPAAVVLGGVLFYRERVTRGNLISVLICILGISLFYTPGVPMDWRGSLLAIVSGFTYAAYILMLAHFRYREVQGFLLNFYIFGINSLVMLLVCLVSGRLTLPTSPAIWVLCFFFALVINVCSVSLFQWGTLIIGGQQAAILSTMEPITSVFVGIFAFQETMNLRAVMGSGLVILASILIVLSGKQEG